MIPVSESDSPEKIEKLEKPPPPAPPQYTAVFADALVAEAERDERVIGITAAMAGGTGLDKLQKALPEQYYDVGIAEQDAVLFASGLAIQGAKPVCAIYSTFLQRAYDQLVHDVCLQKLNVVFAMDRAGLVGDDGPTHHGAFDVSYFRALPNVVVMAPRDEAMLVHMLRTALAHDDGPIAFRYPRGAAEGAPMPDAPEGDRDRQGRDAAARRPRRAAGLRLRRPGRAARRRDPPRQGPGADGRGRALREAARRRAGRAAGSRPRAAGDDRGERAAGRLRLGRARAPRGRLRRARLRSRPRHARRPARPLRHARQAGAAARGGRLHRRGRRRARAQLAGLARSSASGCQAAVLGSEGRSPQRLMRRCRLQPRPDGEGRVAASNLGASAIAAMSNST